MDELFNLFMLSHPLRLALGEASLSHFEISKVAEMLLHRPNAC